MAAKKSGGSVTAYKNAQKLIGQKIFELDVDILIPAALPDVINENNVNDIKTKIIVEGANIPMREHIERQLEDRGILVVPDIVANAGGVISSYAEHCGYGEKEMFKLINEKISTSVQKVLEKAGKENKYSRETAKEIAALKLLKP